jgi:hypothetical protein
MGPVNGTHRLVNPVTSLSIKLSDYVKITEDPDRDVSFEVK